MKGPSRWLVGRIVRRQDLADPASRNRCGRMAGRMGIALNLLLAGFKLLAGLLAGSLAMTADAFNNLGDAVSSVVTLVGFRVAGQRADAEHPFGHGRAEYVSGLIVSLMILLVGFELGKSSVEKIIAPQTVDFSWLVMGILLGAVLVKLWMWRFNAALGRALESQTLMAASVDALSDSVATTAVLVGTLVGHFARVRLDGWLGLGVAVFILYSGFLTVRDMLDLLLGRAPSEEMIQKIADTVLECPEVMGIHDLAVHEYGPGHLFATIHAEVSENMTLLDAHAAADRAEEALLERLGVQAVIHVDPVEAQSVDPRP